MDYGCPKICPKWPVISNDNCRHSIVTQWNIWEKDLVNHLGGLSELEFESIDDGVGAHDKWREDIFPSKDSAILLSVSDGPSFDMVVGREDAFYQQSDES